MGYPQKAQGGWSQWTASDGTPGGYVTQVRSTAEAGARDGRQNAWNFAR